MGSTIARKINCNGVGALRGQRHKTKKKLTQVTPRVNFRIVFKNSLSFPNMRIIICEENIGCNFMPQLHAERGQIVSAIQNLVKHDKTYRFDIHDFVSF